jgi:hypothetical protein
MRLRTYRLYIPLALAALTGVAWAAVSAEEIPPEQVQLLAPFAIQLLQEKIPNPPIKVDPEPTKALGYHVQQKVAAVAMPDKALTARVIEEAGEKDVPVAILATRSLSVEEKEDVVVPSERLATVDIAQIKLPVFFLSVKGKGDERTLQVYSKDGTPLTTVPLKKQSGDTAVPLAMKLTNIDLEKKRLDLVFSLTGTYETTLKLGYVEIP